MGGRDLNQDTGFTEVGEGITEDHESITVVASELGSEQWTEAHQADREVALQLRDDNMHGGFDQWPRLRVQGPGGEGRGWRSAHFIL